MCKNFIGKKQAAEKMKGRTWKAPELNPLCISSEKWHGGCDVRQPWVQNSHLATYYSWAVWGESADISPSISILRLRAVEAVCGGLELGKVME